MPVPVVRGINFDKQLMTSNNLGVIFNALAGSQCGFVKGCVPSWSSGSSTINITAGYPIVYGRFSEISAGDLDVPEYSSPLCYTLVYEIDLSQTPSKSSFTQGSLKFIYGSENAYPTLQLDDLETNLQGKYQLAMANFKLTSTGVTDFVDVRTTFTASTVVSVAANEWTGTGPYTLTKSVSGLPADPAPGWAAEVPDGTNNEDGLLMIEDASYIGRLWTTTGVLHAIAYGEKPTTTLTIRIKV